MLEAEGLVTFERNVDQGLVEWASSYLNERLSGMSVGARMIAGGLADPGLGPTERDFVLSLTTAFTELPDDAALRHSVEHPVEGPARQSEEAHRGRDVQNAGAT